MGKFILKKTKQRGDTIVEVLLAIAIAAFAIGVSYATAQRSLQQSITAREHNEALNIAENQIADLKLRFRQTAPSTFNTNFSSQNHFCLDDGSTGPSDAVHSWGIYQNWNNSGLDLGSPLSSSLSPDVNHPYYYNSGGSPPYGCQHQRTGDGATYYTDITTSSAGGGVNSTVYSIAVRWERLGGGQHNQVTINYKLNGGGAATLGAVTGGSGSIVTPGTTTLTTNIAVMQYPGFNTPPNFVAWANGVQFISCSFQPDGSVTGCPSNVQNTSTYDCNGTVPGTNFIQHGVGGSWDPTEVCRVYLIQWNIPVDATLLNYLDFKFTDDRFCFGHGETWCNGPYNGAEDNNILVYGFGLPSPYQVRMGSFANCTPSPVNPLPGTVVSGTNTLAMYWTTGTDTAYMYVDPNASSPDGTSSC